MVTKKQIYNKIRQKRKKLNRTPILEKKPQRRGICTKILTMTPKKPNSAIRKVVKVRIFLKSRKKKFVFAYVPGEGGHNLQEYSVVLLRGGRVRDLPGMKYRLVRGKLDLNPVANRVTSRSKYGKKRNK